jgi:hypothetical protein
VIDLSSGFVLPLMHHLVKKRALGLFPAVAANVASADDYFRRPAFLPAPRIMTEAALQPSRNADRDRPKLAAEFFGVELCVPFGELIHVFLVCWMRFFKRASWPGLGSSVRWNLVREQLSFRLRSFPPSSCLHEIDYGTENVFGGLEKSAVDSDFVRGKTDDDRPVLCEPNAEMWVEPQADKNAPEIIGRLPRRLELQRKLELKCAKANQSTERSKQR